MAQEGSSSGRNRAIGGVVLALGIAAVWIGLGRAPDEPAGVEADPAPAETEPVRRSEPRPVAPRDGTVRIRSGETVLIEWQSLTGDAPVELELVLAPGISAKSGRLVTPGAGEVRLDAEVQGQADTVELALSVERLRQPGRYLLEIRTDERSHLPLRRFAIEVR